MLNAEVPDSNSEALISQWVISQDMLNLPIPFLELKSISISLKDNRLDHSLAHQRNNVGLKKGRIQIFRKRKNI